MVLRRWIPDLFWGTIFGPAYVDFFGRDYLLRAPGHIVEEIAPHVVYLQLSDSIYDMVERFDKVSVVRQRVKEYIGVDSFWRTDAQSDHSYMRPVDFSD